MESFCNIDLMQGFKSIAVTTRRRGIEEERCKSYKLKVSQAFRDEAFWRSQVNFGPPPLTTTHPLCGTLRRHEPEIESKKMTTTTSPPPSARSSDHRDNGYGGLRRRLGDHVVCFQA
ncbi:hypothetical protein E3N88_23497 [Mikania micrantha]|uniref:Uncharacterized protein n=1 Tax=Mikania micrantha TaxID=192012 RepID=A0A5N6NDF4_9ASTR|nr:hypothetical protein E3N88_23497 [Mikania micrantha]